MMVDAAVNAVLSEAELAARHDVLLQDSGTIVMLEVPGRQHTSPRSCPAAWHMHAELPDAYLLPCI